MSYVQSSSIQPGRRFRTRSDIVVETTGRTMRIATVNVYVHEVRIVQGPDSGHIFWHNLDYAEPL